MPPNNPSDSSSASSSSGQGGGFKVGSENKSGGFGISDGQTGAPLSTARKELPSNESNEVANDHAKPSPSAQGVKMAGHLSKGGSGGVASLATDKLKGLAKESATDQNKSAGEHAKDMAKDAAKDIVKKEAKQLGKKVATKVATNPYVWLALIILIAGVGIILLVASFWENPGQVLKLGWTSVKSAMGIGLDTTVNTGGASRLAYEIPVGGDGTAVAAGITSYNPATAPQPGTYAYKLSKIDWEKAKYQTTTPTGKCKVITQKVVAPDGTKRSVVERVEIEGSPGEDLEGVARANCLEKNYPVLNTVLRSAYVREGVNKALGVRYAYALPEGAQDIEGKSNEEVDTYLRNKTLDRIWKKSGGGVKNFASETGEASEPLDTSQLCPPKDKDCIKNLFGYGYNADRDGLSDEVADCANTFDFKDPKSLDKAILKAGNDLQCGVPSDKIRFMYELPEESEIKSSDTQVSYKAKAAALQSMCEMYSRLQENKPTAIESYKKTVADRLASETNAAMQVLTYADTNRDRFLSIRELSGDAYKIMGMGASQEYNRAVNQVTTGTPTDSGAISRVGGLPNFSLDNGKKIYNDRAVQKAQEVIDRLGANSAFCEEVNNSFFSRLFGDISFFSFGSGDTSLKDKADQYDSYYPKYKAAIATLDAYSRDENGRPVSEETSSSRVTLQDLFLKTILIQSNAATAGNEEGTQNFNRQNIGALNYKNVISRTLGGPFLTENASIAQENSNRTAIAYDDSSRGPLWRMFSRDNPSSVTSRVSVAMTDKPHKVIGNVASVLGSLINPAENLVGIRSSLAYGLTGQSHVAAASESYEMNSLRLDPSGIPDGFNKIDPLKNSQAIEALLAKNPNAAVTFYNWEVCFRESIPTRFHLLHPDEDKKDLYTKYCRDLYDITATDKLANTAITDTILNNPSAIDINNPSIRSDISFMYRANHFYNIQADAMLVLSNPDGEDASLNSSSSLNLDDSTESGGTATAGGSGSVQCATAIGRAKLFCEAIKYDSLGYSQAYRSNPNVFLKNRCAGVISNAIASCKIDCSGLVGQAIYDAFGYSTYLTTRSMPTSSVLKEIPLNSVQVGDFVWRTGHTAVVEKFDAAANRLYIFHASTGSGPLENQIRYANYSGSGTFTRAYRYIGPGTEGLPQ